MINQIQVRDKIASIFNGTDAETISYQRGVDYEFMVATEGFHLDKIANKETKKNFIPVFISSLGGQFNPVKSLKEVVYTIPITIYFPVRFKDDFFRFNEYLIDCFVGNLLTFGTDKCVTNISVAQYGEIENLDLTAFAKWINTTYKKTIEIMGVWMSMTFNLYLSSAGNDYVWGNNVAISLSTKIGQTTYSDSNVTFAESTMQSQSQATSQQAIGENEVEGLPFGTAYATGFTLYLKNTTMYQKIIEKWFAGASQELRFTLSLTLLTKTYSRECYLESVNMNIQKGQLVTMTLSFAKAAVIG